MAKTIIPIWRDTFWDFGAADYADYSVYTEEGVLVYEGRAYKRPDADSILVKANEVCADYLGQVLPVADNRGYFAQPIVEGFYALANDTQTATIYFAYDWSYEERSSDVASSPIVATLDRNQPLIYSIYQGSAQVNFEAIKESEPTPIDPRPIGTPLWPARHNLDTLEAKRKLDGHTFECLYQGHPTAKEGLLYDAFRTYTTPPAESDVFRRMAYIDTADTGSDYLCAIAYNTTRSGEVYIVDVLYTQAAMEQTEKETANLLLRNKVAEVDVESNNGGRGFARAVQALVPRCNVRWFHQGGNKEARVISNAATVQQVLLFPHDWAYRWPTFYAHLTQFKRVFRANAHDDCADAVTGVVEMTEKNNGNYFIAYPRKIRR